MRRKKEIQPNKFSGMLGATIVGLIVGAGLMLVFPPPADALTPGGNINRNTIIWVWGD